MDDLDIIRLRQAQERAKRQAMTHAAPAQPAAPEQPAPEPTPEDPRSITEKIGDSAGQFLKGGAQGIAGLANAASRTGIPGLSGLPTQAINAISGMVGGPQVPSMGEVIQGGADATLGTSPPVNSTERRVHALGEYAAPGAIGGVPGVVSGLLSGGAAGQVRESGGGPVVEAIIALLAGGGPLMGASAISKAAQTRRAIDAVPGIDALKGSAGALYDKGIQTGQTAARGYTGQLQAGVRGIAQDEGLISPTGRMADTYPKVSTAMKMVDDYAGQKMTPEQMRQVQRVFKDAAESADPSEGRIGTMMLKQFKQFVEPLVPEFKQADGIYSRAMRGKEIDDAVATAGTRRTNPEMALSNEFQNLQRKGIRGDMTSPPELEDAIARAAQGGPTRQAAALAGKMAPSGVVSGGFGLGAAGVGAMAGGPIGAAAAAGSTTTAGILGRLLANRLAKGDARFASAVARNGAPLAEAQTPEEIKRAIAALLANSAVQPQQ